MDFESISFTNLDTAAGTDMLGPEVGVNSRLRTLVTKPAHRRRKPPRRLRSRRLAADRAALCVNALLDLDVPLLAEAAHRERDQ